MLLLRVCVLILPYFVSAARVEKGVRWANSLSLSLSLSLSRNTHKRGLFLFSSFRWKFKRLSGNNMRVVVFRVQEKADEGPGA